MKCHDIKLWLLSARESDPLPAAIRRHLEKCARCRSSRQLLDQLDEQVRQLPVPAALPSAKERFLKKLEQTAGPVAPTTQPKRSRLDRIRRNLTLPWVAGAMAASLMLVVGWFLGRGSVTPRKEVAIVKSPPQENPKETPKESPKDLPKIAPKNQPLPPSPGKETGDRPEHVAILVRVMKHNTRLAEAYNPEEQMRILESMSTDLKTEIVRLVKQGSLEEGKAVADLYAMIVRDGVLPRAARLPADKKDAQARLLVTHFQKTAAEIETVRAEHSNDKDVLADLKATALDAANQLEGKNAIVVFADPLTKSRPLLQTLVTRGLTLAAEPDPLNRADLCSEVAARVAPSVILLCAGAGAEDADLVGVSLNELLERGVAGNLEKSEREKGKDARREDAAKIRDRTAKAWNAMEADLTVAPGAQQNDVKRMIGASAPGLNRVAFPGKGKGPPFLRPDEKFVPPGLQKKNQKQSNLAPARTLAEHASLVFWPRPPLDGMIALTLPTRHCQIDSANDLLSTKTEGRQALCLERGRAVGT